MSPHRLTTVRRYKIPNDVLISILRHLDPSSLWRACKAFRRIYVLVMEYSPLLYIFELAIAGMKDGPAPHSYRPLIGRLQLLSTYRKDWPQLNWSHEYKLLIPASTRSGISSGFLHQIRVHGMQYTLELAELPSCRTARPPAMTRHLEFHTPEIENIALDRSQSLVVLSHVLSVQNGIGVVLYFRDLWTFGKHPRACGGVYDFNVGPTPIASVSMAICGHNLAISFEFAGGKIRHLVLNWRTFQAGWLEDNDILFLNENRLLVVRRSRGLPVLSIYNISDIGAVAIERDYELPDAWNRSIIGFSPNTSPLSDQYSPSEAMFYPDPSKRVLLLAVKTPSTAGGSSARSWLIINESYFRPTSRKDRLRVSWHEWSQACLIREVRSSVRGPYINGSRVVYVENAARSSSRGSGYSSRLNVIEFAPYPDSDCCQSNSWSFAGPRSVLVPNEIYREVPPKTVDGRQIEDLRVTEDNIVLFLENRDEFKPVNILTFGAPPQTRQRHEIHSSQR
ncbi:hypothetical protein LshimejAT787_1002800 [Lyophyllum shimeji]|uniref:F-box domain-containing protein n=1 Tax=Lyophyllum shimeji TaxID=47721 RepID=A0A9P3URT0_LYOSH|nr:hypothetical protein LshimejAT787_1002800 [Lyophyllum shimeji]